MTATNAGHKSQPVRSPSNQFHGRAHHIRERNRPEEREVRQIISLKSPLTQPVAILRLA